MLSKLPIFGKILFVNSIIFLVMLFTIAMSNIVYSLYEYQSKLRYSNELLVYISKLRLELGVKDESPKEEFKKLNEKISIEKNKYHDIAREITELNDFKKLNVSVNKYFNLIEQFSNNIIEIGLDEESGIEGSFRKSVHNLETYLKSINNKDLQILQLELRRREKDFIIRGRKEYIDKLQKIIKDLRLGIDKSSLPIVKQNELNKLLTDYSQYFMIFAEKKLKNTQIKISLNSEEEQINKILHKSIDLESIKINNYKNLIYWFIGIALITTVVLAYNISRKIAKPISISIQILNKLSKGEIKYAIEQINELEKELN